MRPPTGDEIIKLNRFKKNILAAWETYNGSFVNKRITYVTESMRIVLICKKSNFMHLCGIDYFDHNNKRFYSDCKKKHLFFRIDNLMIKKDGNTFRKLKILGLLDALLIKDKIRINGQTISYYSNYDYIVRSRKSLTGLGCNYGKGYYYPSSILNLKFEDFNAGEIVKKIIIDELN
ncbi:PBECR4 domain-containing protein [Companilactobacillus nodensis]|nr:PBECR4 domain-containing protein [Companilactobacillus nodensis]